MEHALTSQPWQLPMLQPVLEPRRPIEGDVDSDEFVDFFTQDVVVDPVIGSDGHTYDRFTAYKLMTEGSNLPGCSAPFTFGADNLHFRKRLRTAHPETEAAMLRRRQECIQVRRDAISEPLRFRKSAFVSAFCLKDCRDAAF